MPKGVYPRPIGYRPRKTDPPELVEQVKVLYASGRSQLEIAALYGWHLKRLQGVFRRNQIQARPQIKRDQRGERNDSWKGDQAGYTALHLRVAEARGRPKECSVCGTTDPNRRYDWANLTRDYANIADYARMCRQCHLRYDRSLPPRHDRYRK